MSLPYRQRLVDAVLDELMASLPAVLLVGPRASGKTTTAVRRVQSSLRLDRPSVAAAVLNDPDAVLQSFDPPVLIDEWQLAPSILGAVKRSVDSVGVQNGRFLLTGSSRADLQAEGWPATGRVVRIPMWPMTVREQQGNVLSKSLIDSLFDASFGDVRVPQEALTIRDYVDLASISGFPDLLEQQSERARRSWLSSYAEQIILRDAPFTSQDRDPQRLRSYLQAIAVNTASVVEHKKLYDSAGITRTTAVSYDSLLESLYVTQKVPAWSTNRLSQLTLSPKRYLVEPALMWPLAKVDNRSIVRDAALAGAVIDNFVTAQLRPECEISMAQPSVFHLRQTDGRHEVDLLLEGPGGGLVAIEIKASAAPDLAMAKHLRWLRDQLPDRFALGVVFHTGPRALILDELIWALPISTIWS